MRSFARHLSIRFLLFVSVGYLLGLVKPLAERLGMTKAIDFRGFRTMHASLMRRFGAALRLPRQHGSLGNLGEHPTSKTCWNERVEVACRVVKAVFAEPDEEEKKKRIAIPLKGLSDGGIDKEREPFWEPQAV